MKKLLSILILGLLSTAAFAADFDDDDYEQPEYQSAESVAKPIHVPPEYQGIWVMTAGGDYSGDKRTLLPNGFDLSRFDGVNTCPKKVFYTEEESITGRKLLQQIKESEIALYEEELSEEAKKSVNQTMKLYSSLIDKNKTYTKYALLAVACADGAEQIIPLNEHVGLFVLSAPEDMYSIVVKK